MHTTFDGTAPYALPPPVPHTSPHIVRCALLLTRQQASSFNQPLTFDTSKVKATAGMFLVRSTRDQAPSLYSRGPPPVHAPCAAVTPCTPVSHATPLTPYRTPSFRLGRPRHRSTSRCSSTRPRSQTCTSCFRCAPLVPWPSSPQSDPPPACRFCRRRFMPSSLPGPYLAPHHMCSPFDSAQGASSLSATNKLLIRCAWAGTPAFARFGYGSSWAPGSCP